MALLYVGVNEIRPQKRSARLTDLETWVMKEMQRAQTFASQALLEVASFLRGLCFYGLIVFSSQCFGPETVLPASSPARRQELVRHA